MYKVSDVSELIGVEKTEVFEKMITHRALLESHIHKEDGVTHFNERGLEVLKTLFGIEIDQYDKSVVKALAKKDFASNEVRQDRDRKILLDKISILINEMDNLDRELSLKDKMIEQYQQKIAEELENMGMLQNIIVKKLESVME
ncbi:hypothetical protein [Fusibacter tunisiensis]|uniref:Uncharacterized protein n=1 Tax=Fusibacter tunisiensis TaxID=1008308 RepID=A0ABS2MNM1_9FIRM|nr:hypothetical protein [Fusibacter tunisiensis]MBM7560992.1 hypothetical protein [Fusibacter tunisiensis]